MFMNLSAYTSKGTSRANRLSHQIRFYYYLFRSNSIVTPTLEHTLHILKLKLNEKHENIRTLSFLLFFLHQVHISRGNRI